jgi:hypothetical protein
MCTKESVKFKTKQGGVLVLRMMYIEIRFSRH